MCKEWLDSNVCCWANLPFEPCRAEDKVDNVKYRNLAATRMNAAAKILYCRAHTISKPTEKHSLQCLFLSMLSFPARCIQVCMFECRYNL